MKRITNVERFERRSININKSIALIFATIITVGTLLLLLPCASRNAVSCGIETALFTSTSATCVTGLILADTWTQWSGFGQAVILCLIEIGGLGFMSVASFFIFVLRRKLNMNEQLVIAQTLGSDNMSEAVIIQKKMLIISLLTELSGAALLTLCFYKKHGILRAIKLGVFLSVSAFCNAGFDILGFEAPNTSLSLYKTDLSILLILSFLIIFGGLGFIVWDEIFRIKHVKKMSVYTKLVLIATASLLILGTLFILLTEWNNPDTIGSMSFRNKLLSAFFQSVTTRTAGFAAINQGALSECGKAVSIFLMLIGGSSGSTAGGLKTVTFFVIVLFLVSRIRGKDKVNVFNRTIPQKQILGALTVFGIMTALAFFGATVICSASSVSFTDSLFESVSALATVGLTTNITPQLGLIPHILLILYMYFGRVGILTISLGFLKSKNTSSFEYAQTSLLIG